MNFKKYIYFFITLVFALFAQSSFSYNNKEYEKEYEYIENIAKNNWVNLYNELAKVDWNCLKSIINNYYAYVVEFKQTVVTDWQHKEWKIIQIWWLEKFKKEIWLSLIKKIDKIVANIVDNKWWLWKWKFWNLNKICKIHNNIEKLQNSNRYKNNKKIKNVIKYLDMEFIYVWYKYAIWIFKLEFDKIRVWFLTPKGLPYGSGY